MSFLVVCGLERKPGPPISALCLRLPNAGCWGGDQRALACPEAHEDKQGQCALQGPRAPGCGVFPVFPVTWMCCSFLIIFRWEMWQAEPLLTEHIDSWKGPLSHGPPRHLSWNPGAKEKGGKSKSTFQLLTEWPGTGEASGISQN